MQRSLARLFFFTICILLLGHTAQAQAPTRILILHSYHKGFRWTDLVQQGIEQSFADHFRGRLELLVEYMDTKRHSHQEIEPDLRRLYEKKYGRLWPQVIITSDDNAYQFMLKFGDKLFPGVPVVFCGVNHFKDTDLNGRAFYTGVLEDFSIQDSLRTILQVQPETRRVYVISDSTSTGRINMERFLRVKQKFENQLEFVELSDISTTQLRKALKSPRPNSVILHLSFYRDSEGHAYSAKESIALIQSMADIPIYSCWDFVMGTGTLGGKVVSGLRQGAEAAKLAMSILKGVSIKTLSIIRNSPNEYIFDARPMTHFKISASRLPKGSTILNQPISFYSRYTTLVWSVVAIIILLSLLALFLAFNIRRRIQVEKSLRTTEQRYRSIFENIPDGFYRTDMNGTIELINPEAANMLGLGGPQEARGMNIANLYKDSTQREKFLSQLLAQGHVNGFITTGKRVDGTTVEVEVNSVLIQDEKTGRPLAIEGLVRDISERIRMQEFLVQNEKMMSLGGVAAGMAHEINNPLAGILQGLQNIEQRLQADNKGNREAAKASHLHLDNLRNYLSLRNIPETISGIRDSATRAAGIVENMLNFSRQSQNTGEKCNIKLATSAAISLASQDYGLKKGYDFKNIEISQYHAKNLPLVQCAPSEIEQVLFNILQNAAHAMAEATIDNTPAHIIIQTYSHKDNAVITITDNGPGIPPAELNNIFDPFFTTKPPGMGTGLGLSVSYFIITQKYGGRIEALSPPEGGAKFIISLPALETIP